MTRTRFTPWVVLACIGTLAACTSDGDGPTGNTELNVLIPNGSDNGSSQPGAIDVTSVEYTIVCTGGEQPAGGFLNPGDGFADGVVLNGNLEVNDDASGYLIAQGYMDIPPGDCLAQLRARDNDGEVICTGDNRLDTDNQNVDAGEFQQINIILACGNISFQAPVGNIDLTGEFKYSIGNFCPDLFVLNCLETQLFPTLPSPPGDAGPAVEGQTTCEVRFRDNDDGCNQGCDPQVCNVAADGLLNCFPASPPVDQDNISMAGIIARTTVECRSPGGVLAPMDCDNDGTFEALGGCVYNSTSQNDSTGTLPNPTTGQSDPNAPDFGVNCADIAAPGQSITCVAYTTDGDRDCDKTKNVSVVCPGLDLCDAGASPTPPDCTTSGGECVNEVCDSSSGTATCVFDSYVPGDGGANCTGCPGEADGSLCSCDGAGSCEDFGCVNDQDCDTDSNDCVVALGGDCQSDGTCLPNTILEGGETCTIGGAGSGGDPGTCETGGVCTGLCDDAATRCNDSNECTDDSCNPATGACANTPDDTNSCTTCDTTPNCACDTTNSPPTCEDGPSPFVCERFSPVPLQTGKTCTGAPGDECICEKVEFLAIDCDLLSNSAPLPLNASVQQIGVAFNNQPLPVVVTDAFVLAADLVCGFIDAAFESSDVDNSILANTISNASLSSLIVNSFIDDGTNPASCGGASPCLVSPHNIVAFNFADACGDACTGAPKTCRSDGSSCNNTAECPLAGDGDGIVVPFLFRTTNPESVPPGPTPFLITPNGGGGTTSDFEIDLDNTAIQLRDLVGTITTDACIGGACATNICSPFFLDGVCNNDSICDLGNNTCDDDLSTCGSDADCLGDDTCFGSNQTCTVDADCDDLFSPRVMYENTCSKTQFAACGETPCAADTDCPFNSATGQLCDLVENECRNINFGTCGAVNAGECTDTGVTCADDDDCDFLFGPAACCLPFEIFPDVTDVCKVRAVDFADAPPCCDTGVGTGSGRPVDPSCNQSAANKRRCCAALAENYPDATPGVQPQLPAN